MKEREEMKQSAAGSIPSDAERDYFLGEYDFKGVIADYLEVMILYGFMTMFISGILVVCGIIISSILVIFVVNQRVIF